MASTRAWRAVPVAALVMLLAACSSGGAGSSSVPPPSNPPPAPPPPQNQAPTAVNDVLAVTGSGVTSLDVLANDTDPNAGDALTVTITEAPFVGTATVNSNNTVSIGGLPSGFRGFTRFSYQVRDPGGLTDTANAVVFVDVPAFRFVANLDEGRSGASDLYLVNFVDPNVKLGNATEGALRLGGFRASRNGATVAYTRADPQNLATTEEFWFVKTATPTQPVRVALPDGTRTISRDSPPQYALSPDGRWLAVVAGTGAQGAAQTLYLVDTDAGGAVTAVTAPGSTIAVGPRFGPDSQHLYWLATPNETTGATLWRVPVTSPGAPQRVSREGSATTGVINFDIVPGGSRVVLGRIDGSVQVIAAVDLTTAGTERVVSHTPAADEAISGRGVVLSPDGQRVIYSVGSPGAVDSSASIYAAPLAGGDARRLAAPAAQTGYAVFQISPDSSNALLGRGTADGIRLFEVPLAGGAETPVAEIGLLVRTRGIFAGYDGTPDRIVFERSPGIPDLPPGVGDIRVIPRSGFGATATGTLVGTADRLPSFASFSAVDRGVVVLSERTAAAAAPAQPFAVNVTVPDKLYAISPGVFPDRTPDTVVRALMVD